MLDQLTPFWPGSFWIAIACKPTGETENSELAREKKRAESERFGPEWTSDVLVAIGLRREVKKNDYYQKQKKNSPGITQASLVIINIGDSNMIV